MQVFHTDGIDPETTCKTLFECLQILKTFSAANPNHFPIILRFEPKKVTAIEQVEFSTNSFVARVLDIRLSEVLGVRSMKLAVRVLKASAVVLDCHNPVQTQLYALMPLQQYYKVFYLP